MLLLLLPPPLHQVLDVIEALFMSMFEGLKTKYAAELEAVQAQYPFTPIEAKPLRLTFAGTEGQTRACWFVGLLVCVGCVGWLRPSIISAWA